MISYSKVLKASHVSLEKDVKVITQPLIRIQDQDIETDDMNQLEEALEIETQRANQYIQEAQRQAREIVENAEQKAQSITALAEDKITEWWAENEKQLESMAQEAQNRGYQDGYRFGKEEAEKEISKQYEMRFEQVQSLFEKAHEHKDAIILEAEPFLLELSYAIASQIIKQELDSYPHKFVELIKQQILRFKEKEFITICVHPDDFDFIQSQRNHLLAVVNGETEIKIIPDHSVSAKGCIIRTAYGSVDARIDTQIEEIKKAIQEAGRVPNGGINS